MHVNHLFNNQDQMIFYISYVFSYIYHRTFLFNEKINVLKNQYYHF